jgi:ATP-binding cassette subfamily F protein uup
MKNPNFLILDEPTNDLDLLTLETLENFLLDFKGCLLVVSHDRYFLDKLCEHTFVFEGDGKIKDYPGTYSEYKEWKEIQIEKQKSEELRKANKEKPNEVKNTGKRKLSYNEQREFDTLEKEIEKLETEKMQLESKLNEEKDFEKLNSLSQQYQKVSKEIDEKSFRWLELSEQQQ